MFSDQGVAAGGAGAGCWDGADAALSAGAGPDSPGAGAAGAGVADGGCAIGAYVAGGVVGVAD